MELRKSFDAGAFGRALEAWAWIDLSAKRPLFTSLFGDVFFESDEGCWWLDVGRGQLTREWDDRAQMDTVLGTAAGEDEYLLAPLAERAAVAGLILTEDEIYDFATPPVLGGEYAIENLKPLPFEVALHLSGQIHEQIRDLPDGAQVKIELD
jgi:hypothetical protein